ncbi:hypothetical protein BH09GEM1_BH09GEM1_48090 [soil metagenome]
MAARRRCNSVGSPSDAPNQRSGATFRLIVEAGDWDGAIGTNSRGQSGNIESVHYRDLFELWKDNQYFPVKFTQPAIESVTDARTILSPDGT